MTLYESDEVIFLIYLCGSLHRAYTDMKAALNSG